MDSKPIRRIFLFFIFFAFKVSETAYGLEAAVVPYDVVQCVRVYFCFGFRD
jgi:hypothetical protein